MSYIDLNSTKQRIKALIEAASGLPSDRAAQVLDGIIDRVVRGARIDDIAQEVGLTLGSSALAVESIPTHDEASKPAPIPAPQSAPLALVGPDGQALKRGRGRPRLKPKPKYDPKYGVLSLMDDFGISDETTRTRIEKLVRMARAKSEGGRGIPQTESPNNFKFLRRGGPVPKAMRFLIAGETHDVVPPIISKGSGGDANSIWMEVEKLLHGIEEVGVDAEESKRLENTIRCSRSMQNAGITWIEGSPTVLGAHGVPTIRAETARDILRKIPAFASKSSEFLGMAPSVWMDSSGKYTDEFSAVIREAFVDRVPEFGRKARVALARLLLEPLGSIEHKMYEIAFPEKFSVK